MTTAPPSSTTTRPASAPRSTWRGTAAVARDWAARLGRPAPWPDSLEKWLARCHAAGPLQVVIGLDEQGADYTGGEFPLAQVPGAGLPRGGPVVPRRLSLMWMT
ncbi:2OG-Fe(II) oxygenase [Streptomyces sp. NPDC003006]